DLDLASDTFCALSPFQFDRFEVMPACNIIRGPEAGILDVQLDQHLPEAFMVLFVDTDAAIHLWRFLHFPFIVKHQSRINPANIFPADNRYTGYRSAGGEMLPVIPCNICRPERPGEDGESHLHLFIPAIFDFGNY